MHWYQLSIDEVKKELKINTEGLAESDVISRQQQFGMNQLQEAKQKSWLSILLTQFRDVMILILLAAAVISGFIGDLTDTVVILIIVLINALIGFVQEFRAEKAMQALKQMAVTQSKAYRNNEWILLPANQLVPGDLVMLEAGNAVPADIRLTESANLQVEEAALTGESQPVEKNTEPLSGSEIPLGDRKNMAYKGTYISYGRGKGLVVATGMQTELGKIANLLQQADGQTPLQERLSAFGKKLSVLVLLLCILFFVVGWLRGEDLFRMILTSISLAVAAIPEALPAVITISLALAAKRLVKHNSLIRRLPAVETLGSVSYICTDKTGTLTRNKMQTEYVWFDGNWISSSALKSTTLTESSNTLLLAFSLNNDSTKSADQTLQGDPTETALMELSNPFSLPVTEWPRVAEIPFDSDRKLMTTFHQNNHQIISFTKGAPDMLLERCADTDQPKLLEQVNEMASRGMRVLGFAMKKWDQLPEKPETAIHEQDLTFIGLAGLIDPPREEVYQAVSDCKSAGIVPVMITGDHPLTAKHIAERIGIIDQPSQLVITGQELFAMNDLQLNEKVEQIRVYARVSPEQKLRIVTALQARGHYVAMTGDGVNDAPSLKKANIGVAMGITGTDVSKEASDMILLDDRFSTIVQAVREGRRIYDNILKFIKYLMTTNSGELWTLLIGPLLGLPVALLPIHILWINLVSDGLPAISLSFEKAERNIMSRPPRPPKESVFSEGRGWHMIWVGLLMAIVALGAQAWAIENGLHWQTIVFNVLCLSQMGHVLAIRSDRDSLFTQGIFSNMPLIIAVVTAMILQAIVTYTPLLQPIFKTESLTVNEFAITGALSAIIFIAVELEKWIRRKKAPQLRGS